MCDLNNEKEAIDINNQYVKLFKDTVKKMYNAEVVVVDEAEIQTRTVK